jgi:light-regulated signal transduction histidine kinase (bacteriophytochrome)
VRNLALGPSTPSNALVPLFEAIYNALHAIQEKFGEAWHESGNIVVTRQAEDQTVSFQVRDNGVGLNEENFASFRVYDSDHKEKIGGRGVGRLTWLKVFEHVRITSMFLDGARCFRRSFTFQLDNV